MPFTWAPGFRSLPSNTGEAAVVAAVSEAEVEKLRLYSDPACADLLKASASAMASSGEWTATIFVLNLPANFSLMALAKASAFSKVRQ